MIPGIFRLSHKIAVVEKGSDADIVESSTLDTEVDTQELNEGCQDKLKEDCQHQLEDLFVFKRWFEY